MPKNLRALTLLVWAHERMNAEVFWFQLFLKYIHMFNPHTICFAMGTLMFQHWVLFTEHNAFRNVLQIFLKSCDYGHLAHLTQTKSSEAETFFSS